jgi:hypothetical protein
MKRFFLLSALSILVLSAGDCSKKKSTTYKGKLEIKALCMNYTIRLVEGKIDTSLIVGNWTDENTGKNYKNVFKLGSPCSFPNDINEGDEFYFTIDSSVVQHCAVCMAYYPTPSKSLGIKVVKK